MNPLLERLRQRLNREHSKEEARSQALTDLLCRVRTARPDARFGPDSTLHDLAGNGVSLSVRVRERLPDDYSLAA